MPIVVVGAGVPVVLADAAGHGAPARPEDLEGLNTVVLNLQDEVERMHAELEAAGTGNPVKPPTRGRRR